MGAATRKMIDNRTVGAIVSRAGFRQQQQPRAHRMQFLNMRRDLIRFLQRAGFDLSAVARRIIKQMNQLTAFVERKADLTRLA